MKFIFIFHVFFFFSSRRRHTRWPRDWSSDVCSSDLQRHLGTQPGRVLRLSGGRTGPAATGQRRSEERRVGKECRSRESPHREKQKCTSPTSYNAKTTSI